MKSFSVFAVFLSLAASAFGQVQLGPVRALPGDSALTPAVKVQDAPALAAGANGFLAVWQDQRTVLEGSTNAAFNPGLGNAQDIYAARLDATGKLIDGKPIVISNQAHQQAVPKVAWNGQHWLVAFLTVRPGDYYSEDLVAVRVAPDGTVVDATPKVLRAQDGKSEISNLAVASDGSGWAVVWEDFNSAGVRGVEGIRVEGDGTVGVARSLWYDSSNTYAHHVDIAFATDRFLVTWARNSSEIGTGRSHFLMGLRVTTSLTRIDAAPFLLDNYTWADAARPSVASNGTDFLVAWHEMVNVNDAQIFAARVPRSGALLDPAGIQLGTIQTYGNLTPAVAWNGFEYVVAFDNAAGNLFHQRVGADGRKIDAAPVPVASTSAIEGQPELASLGDGTAQLVYAAGSDISARQITSAGAVTAAVLVSVDRPRQSTARFASHGSGHLIVFLSDLSGQSRVMAQRLDAAGNAIDAEPRVVGSGAEGTVVRPDVAWNGSIYLVVWQGTEGIFSRRLAADGTPLEAPQLILATGTYPWSRPSVGALGSDFLVVATEFHKFSTVWQNWLKGIRVNAAGQVLDATPFLIYGGYALENRVVALGNQWLTVWESRSSSSESSIIRAAFVSPAGVPGTPFTFGDTGLGDDPDVAVQGDTALVVWYDNANYNNASIDGRLLKADGTFASGEIQVVQAEWDQMAPAVTGDGNGGWVVSWVDYRTTPPVAQLRGDIWLARVDAAGTVSNTTQVTTGPLPEEQPDLAPIPGSPGAALLAYSALDPTNYRIALRTVGGGTETPPPPPPPPPASAVASLTLNPVSVVGGKTSTATVTLAQPAPAAGAKVLLTSANVNVATVPVSVTLAAGTTSKTFTVTSKPVASSSLVGITASYSGASKTTVLTVEPPVLSALTLSPATIAGGCQGSTGKVTLSGKAPVGGLVVPLTNTNPVASVPASVTVPAGATYVTFPVTAPAVTAIQTGTVSASFGGITKSVILKVRPIGLASLTLAPNPVVGPGSVTGTVTLECPAVGSVSVALSSSTISVAKPTAASVTIPAGSTTATFTVTTADVSAVSYATIKAVAGGVTKTVRLTVNP